MTTKNLGAQDGRTNPYYQSDESRDGSEPDFDLVASNLARYRWGGPILSRDEERALIRRAQGGDEQAKDRLHRSFGRTVLKIAGQYHGPTRDVLTAAGHLGLAEAIKRFSLSRRNGLRAYAESWIRKFIDAETKGKSIDPETGELSGRESRADRILHSHPSLIDNPNIPNPAELLGKMAGCTPWEAEEAITVFKATSHREYYSTTDSADDFDGTGSDGSRNDYEGTGNAENPAPAASHLMLAMYDCFNRHRLSPQLLHHEILGPSRHRKHAPRVLKPGMVDVAAEAAERLAESSLKEYHRPCFVNGRLIGKTDRKKIGHPEYALQLVEHDLKRSKAYADERLYRYPDSEKRTAEGESRDEQARSRNQMMLVGRFSSRQWHPWLRLIKVSLRQRRKDLPPSRPHHKPKVRHAIIRGRPVTIEEKRYVRR